MGSTLGTATGREVGLEMNDTPSYDPHAGFNYQRKERVMIAKEEDLVSARVPLDGRDYCAHLLLNYSKCRYDNFPLVYKCHHEKHDYLNCEQKDYVIRMKEYERERRLRLREKRLSGE